MQQEALRRSRVGRAVVPLLPDPETGGSPCRGLPTPMATTRCLVVDDDPELLQSVCDCLRRFGFETAAAASAAQMRSELARGGVDVLILDVMLPDGDGLAICTALRQ